MTELTNGRIITCMAIHFVIFITFESKAKVWTIDSESNENFRQTERHTLKLSKQKPKLIETSTTIETEKAWTIGSESNDNVQIREEFEIIETTSVSQPLVVQIREEPGIIETVTTMSRPKVYQQSTAKPGIIEVTTEDRSFVVLTREEPEIIATNATNQPDFIQTTEEPEIFYTNASSQPEVIQTTKEPEIVETTTTMMNRSEIVQTIGKTEIIEATTKVKPEKEWTIDSESNENIIKTETPAPDEQEYRSIEITPTKQPEQVVHTTEKPGLIETTQSEDIQTTEEPEIVETTTMSQTEIVQTTGKTQIIETTTKSKPGESNENVRQTEMPPLNPIKQSQRTMEKTPTKQPEVTQTTEAEGPKINKTTTTSQSQDTQPTAKPEFIETATSQTKAVFTGGEPIKIDNKLTNLLRSDRKIFNHVKWGNQTTRQYAGPKHRTERTYRGYGECPQRYKINYDTQINEVSNLLPILMAYARLLRVYCNDDTMATLKGLFVKGYARLDMDHSVKFSQHAVIFIKQSLTSIEKTEMEVLIELSAFSQVYVSWYTHPVASIDPTGSQIRDASFIEVVSRLHALDLVKHAAKRYIPRIADTMVFKLRTTLREMRDTLRKNHGTSKVAIRKKSVQIGSLAVTLGLTEFLIKFSHKVMENERECAHELFQKFYAPKKSKYVKLAKKLGKTDWHDSWSKFRY